MNDRMKERTKKDNEGKNEWWMNKWITSDRTKELKNNLKLEYIQCYEVKEH